MFDLGKKALYVSFILVVVLYVAQWIFFGDSQGFSVLPQLLRADFIPISNSGQRLENNHKTKALEELISATESKDNNSITYTRKGKPIAIVNLDGLIFINKNGYIVTPPSYNSKYDLPLISGDNLNIDLKMQKIVGSGLSEALYFISAVKKVSLNFHNLVSEVFVSEKVGLVVFLSEPFPVPAILGKNKLGRKIAYLGTIIEQLSLSEKLSNISYIDLRFEDQAILKKKKSS